MFALETFDRVTISDGLVQRQTAAFAPRLLDRVLRKATINMWYVKQSKSVLCRWNQLSLTSKHVLNAQVAIRSPCCRKWFDCAQCHADQESHQLKQTLEMTFACKKCKKAFRKNMEEFEDADEYCPHCDNHFLIEAVEPKARLEVEIGRAHV